MSGLRFYEEPSNLPGNPFATDYALYAEDANSSAVISATMALAYEQRTANLLALWANPESSTQDLKGDPVTWGIGEKRVGDLLKEIQLRLGLSK